MTFLNASLAAAGLACIAIPIIIHLLMNRRRKPVMWGAMRFLLEAYRRQRRRLILEKWLLLAVRCLLVALVGLALGKPLLGAIGGAAGGYHVLILLDNSLAAQASGAAADDSAALERHKRTARAFVASLRDRTARLGGEPNRVGVITLAGPADGLVMPPTTDLAALDDVLAGVRSADSRADLTGGLSLAAAAISGSAAGSAGADAVTINPRRTLVLVLSDFLEGSLDLAPGGDSPGTARFPDGVRLMVSEPAPAGAANVSILGVEPLRSVMVGSAPQSGGTGDSDQVRVLLRRSGPGLDQAANTAVHAELLPIDSGPGKGAGRSEPAALSDRHVVHWSPGQDFAIAPVPLHVHPALGRAMPGASSTPPPPAIIVASIDTDAIPGDNRWLRPLDVRPVLKVGVAAPTYFGRSERADRLDPGAWIRLALSPAGEGGEIEVIGIEPASLDSGRLIGLDALVIPRPDAVPELAWGRVRAFIAGGGLVLVTPPSGVTVHLWADAMTKELGLPWSLARESRALPPQRVTRKTVDRASHDGTELADSGVFSLIEGDLDELLHAVSVKRILPMTGPVESSEFELVMTDGTPLLWVGTTDRRSGKTAPADQKKSDASGRGLVAYLAVALDLEWSDLPAKPLMVPLVQELIRQGVGRARGTRWGTAGTIPGAPQRTVELVRLPQFDRTAGKVAGDPGETSAQSPPDSFRVQAQGRPIRTASVWRAVDAGGALSGVVAMNADARAGRTTPQTRESVGAWLQGSFGVLDVTGEGRDRLLWLERERGGDSPTVGSTANESVARALGPDSRGSPIWYPLLVGALAMAVMELSLARRASHAQLGGVPWAPTELSPREDRP